MTQTKLWNERGILMNQNLQLPLRGLKVVELGTHVAIPLAGRYFASLGAEVIKVESISGDEWRKVGVSYGCTAVDEENPVFTIANANKHFLSLNLKEPSGKEIMFQLLEDADVFLTNVRQKGLEKLGFHYEAVKEKNPAIVYCHFTGYGETGPDASRPGFDTAAFWAKSGLLADLPFEGDYPLKPSGGIGDSIVSANVVSGVMTALYAREKTGVGTFLTASLYQSAIWVNAANVVTTQKMYHNYYPKPKDLPDDPLSFVFLTKDKQWIITAVVDYNRDWPKVCRAYGVPELEEDPRFSTEAAVQSNPEHIRELCRRITASFATKTAAEWSKILTEADIVHSVAGHIKDVAGDEQAWAKGYLEHVTFPTGTQVAIPQIPVQFSEYQPIPCTATGGIGRDTDEILSKLGFTHDQIDALRKKNTVR